MKYVILLLSVLVFYSCNGQSQPDTSALDWLEGSWKRTDTKPGKEGYEIWTMNDGKLNGRGISLQNGDTTFVEKLSIRFQDGVLYYVAEVPQNPEPTLFKIVEFSDNFFKSENPEHDFPKEITYQRTGDQLVATISADGNGITFTFQKK